MDKVHVLVTNNPKAANTYQDNAGVGVEYLEGMSYLAVLEQVRERVYGGWHLMTHPQASNLKPNQCPYKTVLISSGRPAQSTIRDVELIESAISAYHKFADAMRPPCWSGGALCDFMTVDLSVVESALDSSLLKQMIMSRI